jgi:hydroxyacylglutathione hydrolase
MRLRPLPAFSDNYIWTLAHDNGRALVVDPGEAGPVLQAAAEGLRPEAVLLTHHHSDHVGGVGELLQSWPDLRVVAPDDERITTATERVGDGAIIEAIGRRFRVLSIPGHTRSHIAFASAPEDEDLVFCGDTLFSLGCGRMFEGTPTRICCGHEYTLANAAFARIAEPGNPALEWRTHQAEAQRAAGQPTLPSTLADECAANPFLRVDAPEVRATLARRLGREPADRVEAFAELRRWKDGFHA